MDSHTVTLLPLLLWTFITMGAHMCVCRGRMCEWLCNPEYTDRCVSMYVKVGEHTCRLHIGVYKLALTCLSAGCAGTCRNVCILEKIRL